MSSRHEAGPVKKRESRADAKRVGWSALGLVALMEATSTGCKKIAREVIVQAAERQVERRGTPRPLEGPGGVVDHFLHPDGTAIEVDRAMLVSFHVVTAPKEAHPEELRMRMGAETRRLLPTYTAQDVEVPDGTLSSLARIQSRNEMLSVSALGEGAHLDLASRVDDLAVGRGSSRPGEETGMRSIWLNIRRLETPAGSTRGSSLSSEGQGDTYEHALAEALSNIRNQMRLPSRVPGRLPNITPPSHPNGRWDNLGSVTGDEGVVYAVGSLPGRTGVVHREIVLDGIDRAISADEQRHPERPHGITVRVAYHDVNPSSARGR